MTEFFRDELGRVSIDHIGDLHELALLHQEADHIHRAFRHAVSEFLDGDCFRDRHFTGDLLFLLGHASAFEALHATAE